MSATSSKSRGSVIVRKSASVGCTTDPTLLFGLAGAIAFLQSPNGVPYLRLVAHCLWPDCDLAWLLYQLSAVQVGKEQIAELDEALDQGVTVQRLADIVDLPALVSTVGGWKKQHSLDRDRIGRDVDQITIGRAPRGVELRLNQNARPLPYGPANHLLAAFARDLLCDGGKAVALFCHQQRLARYIEGITPARLDEPTETQNIRFDELGRSHTANLPQCQQPVAAAVDLSAPTASTADPSDSPYCYKRADDQALPVDVRARLPSSFDPRDFSLGIGSQQVFLNLHQVNLLIGRLTVARDAYQAQLEAERDDKGQRCAPLAEPDDAAPGHELIEPITFTATVMHGAMLTVDGHLRLAAAIFHQAADGKTQLDAVQLAGHAIAEGDQVRLQRMNRHTVRVIEHLARSGEPAIDFTALYLAATTPPADPEERERFFDDERDAAERFDAARIEAGATVSLFPPAHH